MVKEKKDSTTQDLRGLSSEALAKAAAQIEDPGLLIDPQDLAEAKSDVEGEIDRRVIVSLDNYKPSGQPVTPTKSREEK